LDEVKAGRLDERGEQIDLDGGGNALTDALP
jgi:hypothetical protein